ncbi:hypothetical protein E4U21_006696 [Claviceps maximensis]|nr:hypothetical protein E4U21_006696 [Claviceps maximensis]
MARRTNEFDRSRYNTIHLWHFVPEHHLGMMSSDPRFKGNKELVKGVMSPGLLSNAFAPTIYEKARNMIDLWTAKMNAAQGRPFSALQDLQELAIDIALALVLGRDEEVRITKLHLDFLASKGSSAVCADSGDIAGFARPELPQKLGAIPMIPKFKQFSATCIAPRLQVWIMKKTKWRKYLQRMEKLLSDEISMSGKRLSTAGSGSSECKSITDYYLMREMMMAEKTGSKPNFNKQAIRDELSGYFVVGLDSVATTMSWIVKFLADNQSVQAKLRRQLRGAYNEAYGEKRQPDISEILHISASYLEAFLEESVRCTKTVTSVMRTATVDTEILGHHIPKGTLCFLIVGGASFTAPPMPIAHESRSPSIRAHRERVSNWNDDEIGHFKPERWLKTSVNSTTRTGVGEFDNLQFDPTAGPMLTFGAGPRGCFGKRLAYLELRVKIVLLVWNFTLEKCAPDLSSYGEFDELLCLPTHCYVKLGRAES